MKKIFAVILVVMMLAIFPLASFAETSTDTPALDETVTEGNSTPEKEIPTEGEISAPTDDAEKPKEETDVETEGETETAPEATVTESIVAYIEANLEEIFVFIGTIAMAIYTKLLNSKLGENLGAMNSNSVTIAQTSEKIALNAVEKVTALSDKLASWEDKITTVLDALARTEKEKKALEDMVSQMGAVMKAVKGAAVEASNEVAELILLANLPTSVKDELYSKHLKSIKEIEDEGGDENGSNKA